MEISLVHTGLAAGAALAALPVILHLFMRQTPKRVVFPALRLVRERQKRSRKKLRVKNWLLLLARMALLALMALALARPRIVSEASVGDQEIPTALGLVFDTSLSMGYKPRDKTLLDEAKERALELLKKTPDTSQVFVVDTSIRGVTGPLTPASAVKAIQERALHPVSRPLNVSVADAYAAVGESDRNRREVYVLTDLARSAWDPNRPVGGLDKAAKDKIKTYVLRLTPHDVRDVSVVEAGPVTDVIAEGQPVEVRARLKSLGPPTSRVAELKIDGVSKGKEQVQIPANGEVEVKFPAQRVDPSVPIHQGQVLISGTPDPAEFDDRRFFTFALKPPVNVLVVSDQAIDGEFIAGAIDPSAAAPGMARPFRVDRILTREFSDKATNLGRRYRCVFLNNVTGLSDAEWGRLHAFVLDGGGLVIGLGRLASAESYTGPTATRLLPGTVEDAPPNKPTFFGEIEDPSHPIFGRYAADFAAMLTKIPVSRYWPVKLHDKADARVLLRFADKSPALIERVFKGARTGRVLLWTTPLSRRALPTEPDAWNELPNDSFGWSFFGLMLQTVSYLAGATGESMNFEAGKDVVLPLDPTRRFKSYYVEAPDRQANETLSPPAGSDSLVVVGPQILGNWSVRATGSEGKEGRTGFSVNPPLSETRFVPLEPADLNTLFGGKDRYALADDPESLERAIQTTRIGREMFPWLIMLIMVVVTVESVMANRFYRQAAPRAAAGQA